MKKTYSGFISLLLILAIVAGLAALGAAGWWVSQQRIPESGTFGDQVAATTTAPTPAATGTVSTLNPAAIQSTNPPTGGFVCTYAVKNGVMYWGAWAMSDVDISTFKNVSVYRGDGAECIGVDKNHVYLDEKTVPNSDPNRFAILPPNGTQACKYFFRIQGAGVFSGVWQLPGADPTTFVDLTPLADFNSTSGGTCYGKDAARVFSNTGVTGTASVIAGADPSTFVALNTNYSRDAAHAWLLAGEYDKGGPIPGADGSTFKALSIGYAKDKTHVYAGNKVLAGADSVSFAALSNGFGKDMNHVYYGSSVLSGVSASSVKILDSTYLIDSLHVYVAPPFPGPNAAATVVTGADSATFTALGLGYGKDASNAYWSGHTISGADAATFFVRSGYAADSAHVYDMGKVLPGANVAAFRVVPDSGQYVTYYTDDVHVWYVGGMGVGSMQEIPGADSKTFVVTSQNGNAKDANHIYGFTAKGYFTVDGKGGPVY